ncbi:MAG: DUF2197 domain-containing protein [Syntrophomonadaceae bacterium]|jgi:uncharacterized protein YlaI|nr:DUF2197 domain-containing protein [Syntrophomonadaceae bacterium]MDH7496955.1 DUF2197 domain-containing protein [Syntrophomonadaceae bacterium]
MPIEARCALCGKKYQVAEDHPTFKKLEHDPKAIWICDLCSNRVRYESEDKQKPHKPM